MTVARTLMREQVKELIIQRIIQGHYKPGDRIVELQLMNELGVSQAPVREAVRDLIAMRLLDTEPYKGARVRALSRAELAESYPVRAVLEELAGQMATPLAGPELFGQLESEMQNMRHAAMGSDQHGLLIHDARFHELVIEAAGNAVLLETWSSLRIEAYTLVSVLTSHLDLTAIANAHQPILDALHQGDPQLTGKVMREHITTFADLLLGEET